LREPAKSDAKYSVRTRCPQCGRKHITVFRLRHVSDSFFLQLGHFFRYARHFDFLRLRWLHKLGATSELERFLSCPDGAIAFHTGHASVGPPQNPLRY